MLRLTLNQRGHGKWGLLIAVPIAVTAVLAGCASPTSQTAPTGTTEPGTSVYVPPRPPVEESGWVAETGIWAYDTGYNEVSADDDEFGPRECQGLADYYWYDLDALEKSEYLYLSIFQGCMDAAAGRKPQADQFRDDPPGGVPESDPCLIGDIEPWVVIFDGPAGPGDTTVGAPCQEIAEEEVLDQLPAGSFVVESWRA